MNNWKIHTAVISMCILCFILGITVGLQHDLLPTTCKAVIEKMEPYAECLGQGGNCSKDIQFFKEYHELRHKKLDLCN